MIYLWDSYKLLRPAGSYELQVMSSLKTKRLKKKIEKKWKNCRVLLLFMGLIVDIQRINICV